MKYRVTVKENDHSITFTITVDSVGLAGLLASRRYYIKEIEQLEG